VFKKTKLEMKEPNLTPAKHLLIKLKKIDMIHDAEKKRQKKRELSKKNWDGARRIRGVSAPCRVQEKKLQPALRDANG